jgi:capsular polysaccharide biosynthesis protein
MTVTTILHTVPIKRKKPANMKAADLALFSKSIENTLPPVSLHHLRNHSVTPEGIVFKGLSVQKQFLVYPYHTNIYNPLYVLSTRIKRKKEVLRGEKYLLIFDYWSNSIFHWMCDALPRLQAVKEFAEDCVLLLPDHFRYPYIHETLKAFKLKAIHTFPVDTFLQCEDLYVPEQITTSGEINPENFKALRSTLLSYFQPKFSGRFNSPNIYVSRSKAKHRKVLNENELLAILEKYNFKIIHFEEHTVEEQVEIAFHARNLISAHGANLSNVIFMQPGGNVLEFRKDQDKENNYFYSITDSVDCNYYYLNCSYIDRKRGNFFDLTVDTEAFEQTIKSMLKV